MAGNFWSSTKKWKSWAASVQIWQQYLCIESMAEGFKSFLKQYRNFGNNARITDQKMFSMWLFIYNFIPESILCFHEVMGTGLSMIIDGSVYLFLRKITVFFFFLRKKIPDIRINNSIHFLTFIDDYFLLYITCSWPWEDLI